MGSAPPLQIDTCRSRRFARIGDCTANMASHPSALSDPITNVMGGMQATRSAPKGAGSLPPTNATSVAFHNQPTGWAKGKVL